MSSSTRRCFSSSGTGSPRVSAGVLEFGLGLAGIAYDECGADADVGQGGAEVLQELQGAFAVDAALHGGEYAAVDVLQGDVDVVADVAVPLHCFDGIEGEGGGVGVVQAYPFGTALGGEQFEEFAESAATVEVETVVGGVLGDEYKFLDSVVYQGLRFVEYILDGP